MLYERIDHLIFHVASVEEAAAPYERLGLTLTPRLRHRGGTENRVFFVGAGESNEFYVELLSIADAAEFRAARGGDLPDGLLDGSAPPALMLRVSDLSGAGDELSGRGIRPSTREVFAEDGRKICDVAELEGTERGGVHVRLIQYAEAAGRYARHAAAGYLSHALPLKRLDHLAAVAPDLEQTTRFWTDTLGVAVTGEITTPAMIIRQLKIGDAILELLGPATPDSPIRQRPPGLVRMAACEVGDLEAAVRAARAAGFNPPDPATGVLPGTRTSTIPAAELGGMAMQLLQYV